MRSHILACWAALVCVALLGCRGDKGEASTKAEPNPSAVSGETLRLLFDGREISDLSEASIDAPVKLTEFLPAENRDWTKWLLVEARSADGRRLAIPDPSTRYKDHTPYIYKSAEGWISLGWFVASAEGIASKPRLKLAGASEIRVQTRLPAQESGAGLEVQVAGQAPRTISAAALASLAIHVPKAADGRSKGSSKRMKGWKLRDLIALVIDPKTTASAILHGPEDASHTVSGSAILAADGEQVVIKRNKRGILMLRWLNAEGQREQFADVQRIEVTLAPTP